MNYLVEIAANSLASAQIAEQAGADRIEFCSALETGGLTPSYGQLRLLAERVTIPAHILIRVRPGHFCYDQAEQAQMMLDIALSQELGFAGVVVGALTQRGEIDMAFCQRVRDTVKHGKLIFHRAFDFCAQPLVAAAQLIEIGFDGVLSSGAAATAVQGLAQLKHCQQSYGQQLEFIAAAGIDANNASTILRETGVSSLHASASQLFASADAHPGSLPGLTNDYRQTSLASATALVQAVRAYHPD